MPEIIWSTENDYRQDPFMDLTLNNRFSTAVMSRRVVWRKTYPNGEPGLVIGEAVMLQGLNRHSGKTWTRWRTERMTVVRARKNGPWEVRTYEGSKRQWYTRLIFCGSPVIRYLIPPDVDHGLPGPVSKNEYYPLVEQMFGHYNDDVPSPILRALVGTEDVGEITRRLFGKRRYRRDLVRAVAQANYSGLFLAWQLRGLCPTDWLIPLIQAPGTTYNIRPLLRRLDQQSIRNLTQHRIIGPVLRDIRTGMVDPDVKSVLSGEVEIPRVHNWTELEDWLYGYIRAHRGIVLAGADQGGGHWEEITQWRHLDATPREPMELTEFAQSLVGQADDLRVVIADHEHTLIEWSDWMHNCISGYSAQMRNKTTILGGAYHDDTLIANFEIRVSHSAESYRLVQMLGRFNQNLEDEVRTTLERYLVEKGVAVENYWGLPARATEEFNLQWNLEGGPIFA